MKRILGVTLAGESVDFRYYFCWYSGDKESLEGGEYLRGKIGEYGLEEEVFRLFGEGISSRKIIQELIETEKIPREVGITEQAIDYWRKKWRRKKEAEERSHFPNRIDRMIDFLETKLMEESVEKPASLDAQIRGALAIGKLLELKLKIAGKEGQSGENTENPSLGDLLNQFGEEDFPR